MPSKSKQNNRRSKRRTRHWSPLLAVVLAAGAAHAGPHEALRRGCGLLHTGQFAAASSQFSRALAADPRCVEARVGWGTALLGQGQTEMALREFEGALSLEPTLGAAHLGRGAALLSLGSWGEAERSYAQVAATASVSAVPATAAQAWLRCAQGDYLGAGELLRKLPAAANCALADYVLTASEFALYPETARPPALAFTPTGSYVGLGSSLASPNAAWFQAAELAVVAVPIPTRPAGISLRVGQLQIISPLPGARVRGRVQLLIRGGWGPEAHYALITVGGHFAGMSNPPSLGDVASAEPPDLRFEEPLDTTTWPLGRQELQVEVYDAQGRIIGRASVPVLVETGDMTLAEQPRAPEVWVRRQLEAMLSPELLPGVAEQLRGEVAWQQGQLLEAQTHLTAAFRADPHLPRVREELLTVSQELGLPVLHNARRVVRGPSTPRAVAVTFDDGPHPKITPWILDQLDRAQARATFFLVGKQVEMYPELTREILARGHELGSHTYSHPDLTQLTSGDVERELAASRAVIAQATGVQVTLFRPPGGNYDEMVARAVGLWGFTPVFWTCNICDFYGNGREHVVPGMRERIAPGGIILLHNGEDLTTEILPALLQRLQADGFQMCTVSELLSTRTKASPARTYPVP